MLFVKIIHILFICWVLIVPFIQNRNQLEFYSLFIPFLFLHWALNDDNCALTTIEKKITGKTDNKDTFIGSIVSPIYNLDDSDLSKFNKIVAFALWMYVMYRLHGKTYTFFNQ